MPDNDFKLVAIRYYSFMNPWLDVIVMVPQSFEEKAKECIYKALKIDYWDDEDDRFYTSGYFDYIRDELDLYNIPSSIVCLEEFEENDDLFNNYAAYIYNSGCKYVDMCWPE